jgi:hypothetical protein
MIASMSAPAAPLQLPVADGLIPFESLSETNQAGEFT